MGDVLPFGGGGFVDERHAGADEQEVQEEVGRVVGRNRGNRVVDVVLGIIREEGRRYVSKHSGEEGDENAHGFHVELVCLLLRRMRNDDVHHGFDEGVGRLSVCANERS